jgi:MoxR-like ATPase
MVRRIKSIHIQASVPPMSFFHDYISREIVPGKSEFDVFDYAHEAHMNVLIEGPTGPGKTSAVLAYAAREKKRFYAIPSNVGIEPSQLFGKFIPDPEGGFKWVDGPVTSIVRHGGVLLINEINFIPERVQTVLFGLLDKRRQIILLDHEAEVIDAHDDLLIIADMNPDYQGTRPLNAALRNRFAVQVWWDYDPTIEAQLVVSEDLRVMAGKIRQQIASGVFLTPLSTNMLQEFETIAFDMGIDLAVMNFVNHFASDERSTIRQTVETYKGNIIAQHEAHLDALKRAQEADDGEGLDSAYPDDDPIWVTRREAANGWKDPEWGIKGTEWVWNEEN